MLNRDLFNPIERTREMRDEEFTKYTNLKLNQTGPTDEALIRKVKNNFFGTHIDQVGEKRLTEIWQKVEGGLRQNAGYATFALDFCGDRSDHFFPWVLSVQRSPSEALEMAYGWGRNLLGEFEDTKDDAWFMEVVRNDPTYVYHRERQLYVANLVTSAKTAHKGPGKALVIDLGAGRMDWARWHGFKFEPDLMKIWAFDRDPSIHYEELFARPKAETGVFYETGDIKQALSDERCKEADVVIMQGVASYYPVEIFTKLIAAIYGMLGSGGAFFFDLQLDCIYYRRSMAVFNWPKLDLAKSATEAIDTVERLRKGLWEQGYKFGAEYALDTYNKAPTSVMITLTRAN